MRERALDIMNGSDHDNNNDHNTDDMLMMMLMMKLMTVLPHLILPHSHHLSFIHLSNPLTQLHLRNLIIKELQFPILKLP